VLAGWIPKKSLKDTRNSLREASGGRVIINELTLTPDEMADAPTFYDNPDCQTLRILMKVVSPAKSIEFDPSPLMAIFFPHIFRYHGGRHCIRTYYHGFCNYHEMEIS